MEVSNVLTQANAIAQAAQARVKQAELEETVADFERSEHNSLRSLARVYRMLQQPPY